MVTFSALDILRMWESSQPQHPLDRALTMLGCACPELDKKTLSSLTIGQRDSLLFELRALIFGEIFNVFTGCPQCNENLEFSLSSTDFRSLACSHSSDCIHKLDDGEVGSQIFFRLPDSSDLAVAIVSATPEEARSMLLQRCVIEASLSGNIVAAQSLPPDMIDRLAERMGECEPIADILLSLDCPACSYRWQQPFDIGSFFWTEITVQAKRLMREAHTLAREYGWCEADILAMSSARRNYYLGLVSG